MELLKLKKKAALPEPVISRQEIAVIHADVEQGLSPSQAEDRRACGWANKTSGSGLRSDKQIILDNCITFFNMVFMVLAFFLVIVGSIKELSFLIIVVINTVIGCVQEIRAKRAVEIAGNTKSSQIAVCRSAGPTANSLRTQEETIPPLGVTR